jgi:hypothetical protein
MKDVVKKADPVRIACEVCLKEIPESQARHAEAGDYVMQFCGLECYRLWVSGARMSNGEVSQVKV